MEVNCDYWGDWPGDLASQCVLVVNPLRSYWSMALCAEAALRAKDAGAEVYWLDAPLELSFAMSESLQLNPQDRFRRWLYADPLTRLRGILVDQGITVLPAMGASRHREAQRRALDARITSLAELRSWTYRGLPLGKAVHASLSGQRYRYFIDLLDPAIANDMRQQLLAAADLASVYGRVMDEVNPDLLVTTNDRALPAGIALLEARHRSIPTAVVYWGSSSDRIMASSTSLHSKTDLARHIATMWDAAQDDDPSRDVAMMRLQAQRANVSNVGTHNFRRLMERGHVPPRTRPRRLTFFTGSPWEFSCVEDANAEEFATQWEAASSLVSILDADEWEFVLRHHPPHPITGDHSEPSSWKDIVSLPNVVEIPAENPVDSLELAETSDVSAFYDSLIGVTLIAREFPTLICGRPAWAQASWRNVARSSAILPAFNFDRIPRPDPEDLLPVMHYLEGWGQPMKYAVSVGADTTVMGTRLYSSWLPRKIRYLLAPMYVKWIELRRRRNR